MREGHTEPHLPLSNQPSSALEEDCSRRPQYYTLRGRARLFKKRVSRRPSGGIQLEMPELVMLPLWQNVLIVVIGGIVVWAAGTRLANYADQIARRTSLSDALAGLVLLAFATSLPEVATTLTASLGGNPQLATSNLLGGVALQTALLAVVDAVAVRGALTYFTPNPVLLMQAVVLVLLLATAITVVAVGDAYSVWSVGAGATSLFLIYLLGLVAIHRFEQRKAWKAIDPPELPKVSAERRMRYDTKSDRTIYVSFGLASVAILLAGWAVTEASDAIAEQTGLGATFVGATLLAITTSLPELSTTLEAARLGAYRMAVSNIFGSNAMCLAMFFIADIGYRQGVILRQADSSALFAAGLGIVLTCVYLWGLLERDDRSVARVGWDSAAVLGLYAGGLVVLYNLR